MTDITEALFALAYGAMSALVPVVNAEVYAVVAAGRTATPVALLVVLALACGQTAGKLVLFEAARLGQGRFVRRQRERAARSDKKSRWAPRIAQALRSRRTGTPLVLASAVLGLPPLAAVSLAAGAAGQRRWEFAFVCLVGRTARFAALAMPAALLFS
jgi:membrane protein YqaA with SNARE-associated domain